MSIGSFSIFQDFGAVVMSDLILETRPCLQLRNRGRGRSMNVGIMGPIPFFAASADVETDGAFLGKMATDRFFSSLQLYCTDILF